MKASLRRTSRNKKIARYTAAALVLVGLWFTLPGVVGYVASVIISPVVGVENWLSNSPSTLPAYLRDRDDLIGEIANLKQRIATQGGNVVTIRHLQQENEALRELLGASSSPRIAAGVLARPPSTPYDVLVLDQGVDRGIVKGAPVFIGRDQVIGYVTAVFDKTSVVTLVTSPDHQSTAFIIGPDIYTTAVGQGGGMLLVGVPQGILLTVGDLVVLPAFEAGVYGEIVAIESIETRPEQYAYVAVDVPLQSIRFVSVGREAINPQTFESARETVAEVKDSLARVPVPEGVLIEIPQATTTSATSTETEVEE